MRRFLTLALSSILALMSATATAAPIRVDVSGSLYSGPVNTSFEIPDDFQGGTLSLGSAHIIHPADPSPQSTGWLPMDLAVDSRFNLWLKFSRPGSTNPLDTAAVTIGGPLTGRLTGGTLTSNVSGGFQGAPEFNGVTGYSPGSSLPSPLLTAFTNVQVTGVMTGGVRNLLEMRLVVPKPAALDPGTPQPVPEPTTLAVLALGLGWVGVAGRRVASRRRDLFQSQS